MAGLLERLRLQGEEVGPAERVSAAAAGAFAQRSVDQPRKPESSDVLGAVGLLRERLLSEHPGLLEEVPTTAAALRDLRRAIDTVICRDNVVVQGLTREALAETALSEIAGSGPIEPLLRDPSITDVMVNGPEEVWVEREGTVQRSDVRFRDETHLRETVARFLAPLGRRLDNLAPFVDARLRDGSRLNVVIPPIARHGCIVTIRRFRQKPLGLSGLVDLGFMSPSAAAFLRGAISGRFNLLISGGAGSGKTTLLNALCGALPPQERVITIEDAAELRLTGVHAVGMEARPPNVEGLGEVTIRQLLRNALRMRPDRLVIGEIRDAAAFEFLQAINTGHAGSMCTVHANTAADALYRLENLALMAAGNVVLTAIRDQVASALDLVIHLTRSTGGLRRLSEIGVVNLPGTSLATLALVPATGADTVSVLELLAARASRRCGEDHASQVALSAASLVGGDGHGI